MKKILLLIITLLISNLAFAATSIDSKKSDDDSTTDEQNTSYTKIEAGVSKPSKTTVTLIPSSLTTSPTYNGNFVGGIGGGYKFNKFFRTELMFQYTKSSTKHKPVIINDANLAGKIKVNTYNFMFNGYLDGHNHTIFIPYIMAGIGVANHATKTTKLFSENNNSIPLSTKTKKNKFIWNIGAGVITKIHDQTNIGIEYRYVNFGNLSTKSTTSNGNTFVLKTGDLKAHQVLLSLIYHL